VTRGVERVYLLLRKDLLVLRRSPALVAILAAYPLMIAVLIGLAATYANAKPRVGLVDEDHLPPTIVVAGKRFHVDQTIDEISRNVKLVRLSPGEADRQLRDGRLVGVITVPPGFLTTLQGLVHSPHLILTTGEGGITPRVRQQMQALVYNLNLRLQRAFTAADRGYVNLLLHGGHGAVLGREFKVLGLDGTQRLLRELPSGPQVRKIEDFVHDARIALALAQQAVDATAHPIQLETPAQHGRSWALSAQVQAYALALTISFLSLLLAAGAIAAERDENVIGRLARGLVSFGQLVWAKVALAATVALLLGAIVSLIFAVATEAGNVTGGEPWQRLPLLAVGLVLAGASLGAIGALIGGLTREARTASLVAVLCVLPFVFLGLVPREIVPPAGWISNAFPFVHAVRFFAAALCDVSPWRTIVHESLWLVGLGAIFGVLASRGARRLAA
jgi:ABC-type multidrug transport system permease subunit